MFGLTRKICEKSYKEEGNSMTEFEYDCLQKKRIGNNAFRRVGLRRAVTLPSDSLDPAALQLRNGPCRTYRLGRPMNLAQFEAMPEDLRRAYLRRLRQRGGTEETVGRMLGISPRVMQQLLRQYRVRLDQPDPRAWAAFLDE